ncbi:hypothetical protein PR048_004690 [Dryococelus australis]|uniref:MADF domain-containing protein n=1 Tax=Dryococelus australis TaxID=614101 RepID=A0ABQ9I643_9NEOP|nr:hypothetical protein PR048_004690 [Dryococelus australis]
MAAVTTEREVTVEFLELYKEFGCLWDMSSKQYSNKDDRNQALEILFEKSKVFEGDATIATVKKKIENMRAAYKRERNEVQESKSTGSGREDVHVPTLCYYEYLTFLDEKDSVHRKGVDTVSTRGDDEDEDQESTCFNVLKELNACYPTHRSSFPEKESETQTQARRPPARKRRATNILRKQKDLIENAKFT